MLVVGFLHQVKAMLAVLVTQPISEAAVEAAVLLVQLEQLVVRAEMALKPQ